MKKIRKDIEISDLIYKSLRGETSKSEDELLEAWCLEPRNRKLFMELREADYLYEGVADMYNVDTKEPFKNVEDRIRRGKRVRLMKYVSGVAAVLLVGVVFLGLMEKEEKISVRQVLHSSISRGKMEPFATLVTTAGKVVYLEDSVKQEVLEVGGNKETLKSQGSERDVQFASGQEVEYNVLTTSKQGNIKVVLYDGSLVWLNAGSELRYPNTFVENQRVVYLKGEAYFDVTKDRSHPFVVKTISSEISVLGTSFNVNTYVSERAIRTTLVSGKVRVGDRLTGKGEVILPGQQVVWKDGVFATKEVDTSIYTAWIDGKFYFEGATLEEITAQLERWYDIDFFFTSDNVKHFAFAGVINKEYSANKIFSIIEKTTQVHFSVNGRVVTVSEINNKQK